jgi:pimeloyl-ACP methyl ester carboxylesterase
LDQTPPGAVLVGHSMGGYAITAAAERAAVPLAKLIYLCAYVPRDGLSLAQMRMRAARQPLLPAVQMAADGLSFTLDAAMVRGLFYHDCPDEVAAFAQARLCAQAVAPTNVPLQVTARSRDLPRHYILCEEDRTIPPEFQAEMTQGWPAVSVDQMACGHSPFFADPQGLAGLLDAAVKG